jgi:hypothetical protein
MAQSRPYPPVRSARYEAWRHRLDELDTEYSESMPQEVWTVSQEARSVRRLQLALDDIGNASRRISPYGFVDFSPENDPHGEDDLRGAALIDLLVQVTGIPKARIVITGETFNSWSRALQETAKTESRSVINRSPVGRFLNATAALGILNRAARDHIHTEEEISPEDLRPHYLSQTRHAVIELCDDDEQELRDLVNNVERLTGIKADYPLDQ